ncbi:Hypothetical predicted protein [Olea europaea subsp. europaea]|uniref:Uncharacterized protein n=1 Tax=Olea europaea subsp. europaea TaxID=158383 RepID=A0A8S0PSG3_OLEEU|nr:Hypothetical predicted protein [Olea europaea subsp. europaea]
MRNYVINSISSFFKCRTRMNLLYSCPISHFIQNLPTEKPKKLGLFNICDKVKSMSIYAKPISNFDCFTALRHLNTSSSQKITQDSLEDSDNNQDDSSEELEPIDSWEEEDDADPEVGDGGDGGGVVLQNCPWGQQALAICREVLLQFGDDMELYAYKTSPRGYIYVRLDKLSNEYGCPSMEEIESFSRQYKKRLDEVGAREEIPDDLALEVISLKLIHGFQGYKYMLRCAF